MKTTNVKASSILGRHGFRPVIYVYEGDRFLWKQMAKVYFVKDQDAIEFAQRMRLELMAEWINNSTKAVA